MDRVLIRDKFKTLNEDSPTPTPAEPGETSNYFKLRDQVRYVFLSRQIAMNIWRRMKKVSHRNVTKTLKHKLLLKILLRAANLI